MNGRTIQQELCAICHVPGHATITCPPGVDFPKFVQEQENMINSYYQNPRFDPHSNSYNPGFGAHPNFSWKNTQNEASQPPTTTLENMVRQLAISQQKLAARVGQIAEALSRREAEKFSSQTEINPNNREQAMAIIVCDEQQSVSNIEQDCHISSPRTTMSNGQSDIDKSAPPEKKKVDENKAAQLTEECSAISQKKLLPKLKDPESFTIPFCIANQNFEHALLDLGVSINLMSLSIFESLNIGALKKTSVSIQLADRSIRYPKRVLEDILVKVYGLIFPADFLMLDMRDCQDQGEELPLILG
ncbi:uncharacterized protein LOC120008735 [Tripterygium wilfordii]|uniref:uncharacterized protein LOC120008735 n=1 Tax=Tripterygium wilfordii TaxID=458696 RepID=UPI0018F8365C|nr:uncharacterized protein LOC120008735 [Tripterygium wilfordii]